MISAPIPPSTGGKAHANATASGVLPLAVGPSMVIIWCGISVQKYEDFLKTPNVFFTFVIVLSSDVISQVGDELQK
jgi:hypothetical protein